MAAHGQRWAEAEAALQGRLDPIDWATYEPHVAASVAAFCGRASVLLGSLLQLVRTHFPSRAIRKKRMENRAAEFAVIL